MKLLSVLTKPVNLPSPSEAAYRHLTTAALACLVPLALYFQWRLLGYQAWGDEYETIVTARMLAADMPLYSYVFNHHGPLTFLPGYVLELFGQFGVTAHRVPIALMQWLAFLSIYCSPTLRAFPGRRIIVAAAVVAVLHILKMDQMYGHAYVYQAMAGVFFVIILAQLTLPVLAGMEPAPFPLAIASVLLASLPFLAVSYVPAAGLLLLASLSRANWKPMLAWSALAVAGNLAFLGLIGSFKGYFAYHFYLNSQILPQFTDNLGFVNLVLTALKTATGFNSSESVSPLPLLLLACAGLALLDGSRWRWRSLMLMMALLSFAMRGINIHGAPFWYGLIALAAILLARQACIYRYPGILLGLTLWCVLALALPTVFYNEINQRSDKTLFGELAKLLTNEDDRVLAYTFRNMEYVAANRLPASGHFFYLPWQASYHASPVLGIGSDPCADLARARPKMIALDRSSTWNKFTWQSYGGCVDAYVGDNYTKLPYTIIYIRNDEYARALPKALAAFPQLSQPGQAPWLPNVP